MFAKSRRGRERSLMLRVSDMLRTSGMPIYRPGMGFYAIHGSLPNLRSFLFRAGSSHAWSALFSDCYVFGATRYAHCSGYDGKLRVSVFQYARSDFFAKSGTHDFSDPDLALNHALSSTADPMLEVCDGEYTE